jgi:hypothetical protein
MKEPAAVDPTRGDASRLQPTRRCEMRYLLLLYGDATAEAALVPEDRRAIVEAHMAFSGRLAAAGALVEGAPVAPSAEARVLRAGENGPVVTDGPFAETKEQLGGFYLLECADAGAALAWARQVPRSPGLVVELRPLG